MRAPRPSVLALPLPCGPAFLPQLSQRVFGLTRGAFEVTGFRAHDVQSSFFLIFLMLDFWFSCDSFVFSKRNLRMTNKGARSQHEGMCFPPPAQLIPSVLAWVYRAPYLGTTAPSSEIKRATGNVNRVGNGCLLERKRLILSFLTNVRMDHMNMVAFCISSRRTRTDTREKTSQSGMKKSQSCWTLKKRRDAKRNTG